MSARGLLDASGKMIQLWAPIPRQFPIEDSDFGAIGDVGYLDDSGGFNSLFNIFLTYEENRSYGYGPLPPNFAEYASLKIRNTIIERIYDLQPPGQIFRYSYDGRFVPANYKPGCVPKQKSIVCPRAKQMGVFKVCFDVCLLSACGDEGAPWICDCIQSHCSRSSRQTT